MSATVVIKCLNCSLSGTNGGFTLHGLIYSALGGLVIGFAYFIALLFTNDILDKFHQASLLIFLGIFAGIFGSVFDSILGATLQYSGNFFFLCIYCAITRKVIFLFKALFGVLLF